MITAEVIYKTNDLNLHVFPSKSEAGAAAAKRGAACIRQAIFKHGEARIVFAAAASQFEMFDQLLIEPDIDWYSVTAFQLDEYVGLPISHPGSFRRFLWERFNRKLPVPLQAFHFLNGEGDCTKECRRVGELVLQRPADVAFVGIGENGHIAFNDPPADFKTKEPYHIVELDEKCRLQQYTEGWFDRLENVPRQAISMTVNQIMSCSSIVCTVLDDRKAEAVRNALTADVTPECPASILQHHKNVDFYLDQAAASLLA